MVGLIGTLVLFLGPVCFGEYNLFFSNPSTSISVFPLDLSHTHNTPQASVRMHYYVQVNLTRCVVCEWWLGLYVKVTVV